MKDDVFWCSLCNTIIFLILFLLSVILIIYTFEMFFIRILLILIAFFVCGFIEERILSKYVNSFVEYLQNKKNKK